MSYYSITELFSTVTAAVFQEKIELACTIVGLSPTTWKVGGITNVVIRALADLLGLPDGTPTEDLAAFTDLTSIDGVTAAFARSGFLEPAAEVTVEGGPGWLDILVDSLFDVTRTEATQATGPVVITNAGGTARGPFAVGTYHLVNTSLKKTYSNTEVFSLPALTDTTVTFEADESGSGSTTVANVLTPSTSFVGITVKTSGGANTNTLPGTNTQSNASLITSGRGRLQSLGPRLGPNGAYIYFATAPQLTGYPTLSGGVINRVSVTTDALTGIVRVYLANAAGPAGGGDVALLSTYLSSVVVPKGAQATILAAVTKNVDIELDVYVPAANSSTATADVQAAISAYIAALPLGGTSGQLVGLQISALTAAIFTAVSYVQNVTNVTINSVAADIVLAASECAVASPAPTVTVHST